MAKLIVLGNSSENGNNISLDDFSWDCGWYWGGGYLGNRNCHYHLSSYFGKNRMNAFDAIKQDFGSSLDMTDAELFRLLELFNQFYKIRDAAEVLHRSVFTSQGKSEKEINESLSKNLNTQLSDVVIPEIRKHCELIKENRKLRKNQSAA